MEVGQIRCQIILINLKYFNAILQISIKKEPLMDHPNDQQVTTPSSEQKHNSKATKQKWSIKKKIVVIVSAIVVFIIAIITAATVATSAPLKVSDEFVSGIQSGNASAAYDLMSSDAQAVTSSEDFATVVNYIEPILTGKPDNKSKEVSAETGSDPTAKVVYEVAGSDNYTYVLTVNLVQKSGEWKVLNFESVKK